MFSLEATIDLRQRRQRTLGLPGAMADLAREFGISRTTAYNACQRLEEGFNGHLRRTTKAKRRRLEKQIRELQEDLRFTQEYLRAVETAPAVDPRRLEDFVLTCAVRAVTLRGIVELVERAFRIERSHTWAKEIIDRASRKAKEVFEKLRPWEKATQAVGDEIFLGAWPLLLVAEPHSLAVLRLSVEEHRDEKTWTKLLEPLGPLDVFASDLGKGMTAAVEARGWPHQADVFHALRILSQSLALEERRAYEAIEEEYAYERHLRKLHDAGADSRGVATNYALARKKTQRALERFGEIERLADQMRSAVALCDPFGRWISPDERERRIGAARKRLEELGLARRRRVAGYWANPKLLTFARQVQERLDAVEISSAALARREIIDAAVGVWALAHGRIRGRGKVVASLRALAARQADPVFPSVCAQVQGILDGALRASSAIETLNSLWRVYQQVKKSFGTKFAYLVALYHNMRPFSEGPRKGRTPFDLLDVSLPTGNWLELLRQ